MKWLNTLFRKLNDSSAREIVHVAFFEFVLGLSIISGSYYIYKIFGGEVVGTAYIIFLIAGVFWLGIFILLMLFATIKAEYK